MLKLLLTETKSETEETQETQPQRRNAKKKQAINIPNQFLTLLLKFKPRVSSSTLFFRLLVGIMNGAIG